MTILAMTLLPLLPFMLNLTPAFDIALSMMVLLVAIYIMERLGFSPFPAVLLEGHGGSHTATR